LVPPYAQRRDTATHVGVAIRLQPYLGYGVPMAAKKTATRRSWGTLRTMRNGRIQASYINHEDGLRYYATHTYDAKLDAEGWLANERKLIDLGEWSPPEARAAAKVLAGVKLGEYTEQWLAHRDLTPKTQALYTRLLKTRILPDLGDEYLRAVTPASVRAWWVGLGKTTPTSNTHAYQLLKAIFNTAQADKLITENPCQIKAAGKPPKPRDVEALTPAELDKVAESVPERYRVAVPLAAWCGLRFGELIELRRKDVHNVGDRTVLQIRRAATRVDERSLWASPRPTLASGT
jgi:integrase